MCGINGILRFDRDRRVRPEMIKAMSQTLVHRGPDEEGIHVEGPLGLGFRRLSIIDLVTGQQPLFNEDRTLACVCNGEIFNFKELRGDLEARGHRFRSRTDVEIIPHLYEERGTKMVHALSGQFAFAVHDKTRHRLFMARDHVGIAPLFYTVFDDSFIFASEIKAILTYPGIPRRVDMTTLDQILTFPGPISPGTMFENIHAVPPGHAVVVESGNVTVEKYWDLTYPREVDINPDQSEEECISRIESCLATAVERRLQADVPVGFYLSGGIDSSLIASLISQAPFQAPGSGHIHGQTPVEKGLHGQAPGSGQNQAPAGQGLHDHAPAGQGLHGQAKAESQKNGQDQRHSFSIGFTDQNIDERRFQRIMADHVKSLHHETLFDWPDIADNLKKAVFHAETPLKESYDTCSLALSGLVNQNRLKVVLTGEGADELFAGYVGYRFDLQRREDAASGYGAVPDVEEMLEREIRERVWGDPDFLYERDFYQFKEIKEAIYAQDVAASLHRFDATNHPVIDPSCIDGLHPLHKRSYVDFKLRIADHLLADHGDRVAFANSVEARYPFLDIDLIAAVQTLPPDILIKGGTEKYILKKLAGRHLPDAITQRTKFAFVAPGSPYLLRQQIEWIEDILSFETIKHQGYFNPHTVENLKKMYRDNNFSLSQTFENDLLMIVLTFGIFLETFKM
ncbi:MAG: asparagine synthase (glutamine-hydrolyzing) [Desulfamplus sp.]|nr:asparagine synthase (glutamine-hydrolyzing) [Desulfamplus sp.]